MRVLNMRGAAGVLSSLSFSAQTGTNVFKRASIHLIMSWRDTIKTIQLGSSGQGMVGDRSGSGAVAAGASPDQASMAASMATFSRPKLGQFATTKESSANKGIAIGVALQQMPWSLQSERKQERQPIHLTVRHTRNVPRAPDPRIPADSSAKKPVFRTGRKQLVGIRAYQGAMPDDDPVARTDTMVSDTAPDWLKGPYVRALRAQNTDKRIPAVSYVWGKQAYLVPVAEDPSLDAADYSSCKHHPSSVTMHDRTVRRLGTSSQAIGLHAVLDNPVEGQHLRSVSRRIPVPRQRLATSFGRAGARGAALASKGELLRHSRTGRGIAVSENGAIGTYTPGIESARLAAAEHFAEHFDERLPASSGATRSRSYGRAEMGSAANRPKGGRNLGRRAREGAESHRSGSALESKEEHSPVAGPMQHHDGTLSSRTAGGRGSLGQTCGRPAVSRRQARARFRFVADPIPARLPGEERQ